VLLEILFFSAVPPEHPPGLFSLLGNSLDLVLTVCVRVWLNQAAPGNVSTGTVTHPKMPSCRLCTSRLILWNYRAGGLGFLEQLASIRVWSPGSAVPAVWTQPGTKPAARTMTSSRRVNVKVFPKAKVIPIQSISGVVRTGSVHHELWRTAVLRLVLKTASTEHVPRRCSSG